VAWCLRFVYLDSCCSSKTVVLNVWHAPHRWGVAKFWWGVEVEDIMNQSWWEYKMKMRLLAIKLIGRYKAGSLVYFYRTTIKAC